MEPTEVDVNNVLSLYVQELARMTQRALVAEAACAALQAELDSLKEGRD